MTTSIRRTGVLLMGTALLAATLVTAPPGATAATAPLASCGGAGPVCMTIADATVVEGDSGSRTITFPVSLSRPASGAISVKYRIQNGTATGANTPIAGVDHNDKGGALNTLTFAPGGSGLTPVVKLVSVTVYPDTAVEGDETLRVTLSSLSGAARLRRARAVGTILDDDAASGVRADVGDASVGEGDSGKTRSLVVPVTLSAPATSRLTLNYTVTPGAAVFSSSGAPGSDFGGKLAGTVTFTVTGSGKTAVLKKLSIPVWADTSSEAVEHLTVTISAASLPTGVSLGRATGTAAIVDDDAPPTAFAVPNSMASLGDSMTTGFNACPAIFGECPAANWASGTDGGVVSHYTRLLALNPAIAGNTYNYAVTGARMGDLKDQAPLAVAQGVDYVTIQMGANDACKATEAQMTSVSTFQSRFQQAMTTLTTGLPDARILVASIPDIKRLWEVAKGQAAAVSVWSTFGLCQAMLANPTSNDPADADRRDRVRQRVVDYNAVLATVCGSYANCRFDGNAVFDARFSLDDVSNVDYFHPSYAGQTSLAITSYEAGFGW